MTWGTYWMFYDCKLCGKKVRYSIEDMSEPEFGKCPDCGVDAELAGETKDVAQGEERFVDYEYVL